MAQPNTYKRVCFTLNNYTEADITRINGIECEYIIYGRETAPVTGTKHLQGYVRLKSPRKFVWWKKALGAAHIERSKGDEASNKEYCSKSGDFYERGDFIPRMGKRGAREDLKGCLAAFQTGGAAAAMEAHGTTYIRYHRHIRHVAGELQLASRSSVRRINGGYRVWQQLLLERLQEPSARCIQWVCDLRGGSGKTTLGIDLIATHGALRLENAKTADAAYAYNGQPIVVFDFSRSQSDIINYGLIESLKNGAIFSPKYESACKVFDPPHVVVFANFECPIGKFSDDRIRNLFIDPCDPEWSRLNTVLALPCPNTNPDPIDLSQVANPNPIDLSLNDAASVLNLTEAVNMFCYDAPLPDDDLSWLNDF